MDKQAEALQKQSRYYDYFIVIFNLAVQAQIAKIRYLENFPAENDFKQAHGDAAEVLFQSDVMLYSAEAGAGAERFDRLAIAFAIMSFEPGGVEGFGSKWEELNACR